MCKSQKSLSKTVKAKTTPIHICTWIYIVFTRSFDTVYHSIYAKSNGTHTHAHTMSNRSMSACKCFRFSGRIERIYSSVLWNNANFIYICYFTCLYHIQPHNKHRHVNWTNQYSKQKSKSERDVLSLKWTNPLSVVKILKMFRFICAYRLFW